MRQCFYKRAKINRQSEDRAAAIVRAFRRPTTKFGRAVEVPISRLKQTCVGKVAVWAVVETKAVERGEHSRSRYLKNRTRSKALHGCRAIEVSVGGLNQRQPGFGGSTASGA